ncbi:MAG: S9 family peptidase [Acidobacteriota bacterium]|nr:S9 family peptidase [Acidobacteriota bacterium]
MRLRWCVLWLAIVVVSGSWGAAAGETDDLRDLMTRMARIRSSWSPTFGPESGSVAFVSDLGGVPQVWLLNRGETWPQPVTTLEDQVGGVSWSPDGAWLAFTLAPGGGMNGQIYLVRPDGNDLRLVTDGGKENNWFGRWNHDGSRFTFSSNRDRAESMDIYVYDLKQAQTRLVVRNPGIGAATDVSRDGKRAVVWRMEHRGDSNLVLFDLASGNARVLTPHEGPGSFGGGLFSADGSVVYLSSNAGRDLVAFAVVRLGKNGEPGPIEVLVERDDAELQSFELSPDRKIAALIWNVAGRSTLEYIDLETMAATPGPDAPGEVISSPTFSSDGRHLAVVVSGAAAPRDIWIHDRESGQLVRTTFSPLAGVDPDALIRPELVRYEARDRLELSGWLYRPRGVDGPVPYVISFHGGPEGQERPRFRSVYQAILSTGIGVFAPNVRGSSGFGKEFVNLDNGELRFKAIEDIEASVAFLVGESVADPERIGIMGGSYGGYMTMAGLAWYPELFAAGANLFGVVNFETFFAETEPWMAAISKIEYGDPETQKEMLRELSPIHKVDEVKAPTIVLHGANDTNVPVVEAEQVVESLEERGIPVKYVLFPDEGHGFRKTANRITSDLAIAEWFDEHLNAAR